MNQQSTYKTPIYRIGIGLLIISTILWTLPILIPFLPLTTKIKIAVITGVLIVAEILFWIGVIFAGKEVAMKFKKYINPRNWKRSPKTLEKNNHGEE